MSAITAITSSSSSSSIPTNMIEETAWKNFSFSKRSRRALHSLAKVVSTRTTGLFSLRTPEFSQHSAHSAPSSPVPSERFKRGPIPRFSTTRVEIQLPKIIITPADEDEESSEVEPLTDSSQEFPNLFWPYNRTYNTELFEQKLPKEVKRDRPLFGGKRVSMALEHSIKSEEPEMPEGTPTLTYNYKVKMDDNVMDGNKENDPSSTASANPTGFVDSTSFDSLSTAEINLMLGKIRRARKRKSLTAYMGDYPDSKMDTIDYERDLKDIRSSTSSGVRFPVMTTQYAPTIKAVSPIVYQSSN